MHRPAVHLVKDPAIWSVLIAPARYEILETLRFLAPCSIAELAKHLAKSPDALYRHVRLLQRAGLVVHAGYRKSGRQTEELFDLIADDVRIGFSGSRSAGRPRLTPDERAALDETVAVFLRVIERTYTSAANAGELVISPTDRNFALLFDFTWLTPESFAKARDLLAEYFRLLDEGRKLRQGRQYASVSALLPVVRPAPRRRTAKRSPARSRAAPAASTRQTAKSSQP